MAILERNEKVEKYEIIEIARKETGFFTSIFVFYNSDLEKIPMAVVDMPKLSEKEGKICIIKVKQYIVMFKDLETGELFKFSVSRNSELLNRDEINADNTFLIEKMQEYVRIFYAPIIDYYKKKISLDELTSSIKIPSSLFTKSRKLVWLSYYLTDEQYWQQQMSSNIAEFKNVASFPTKTSELAEYFYPIKKVYRELFCKCVMWSQHHTQVEYWKNMIVYYLYELFVVIKSEKLKDKAKFCFYKFFNPYLDVCDVEMEFYNTLYTMEQYFPLDLKKFGVPNKVDYKIFLRLYRKYERELLALLLHLKNENEIEFQEKKKSKTLCVEGEIRKFIDRYIDVIINKSIEGKCNVVMDTMYKSE